MSDERRQSSVNLDELERQLREASRARMRAQQSADAISPAGAMRPQSFVPSQPGAVPQHSSVDQGGLPLSPAPAPAPTPSISPSSSQSAGFRPLQPQQPVQAPQAAREFGLPTPPVAPREPQQTYQPASPPRPRDVPPVFSAPSEPTFSTRAPEPRVSDEFKPSIQNPLKADRMGDVYPPVATEPVVQDQYYSAAAYEEPAENAYDQYTEDQFPRIDSERRTGGVVRAVVWLVVLAIIGGGIYYAYPLVQGLIMPSNQTAKAPPLIKPDPNPVKVQPEAQPQADNAGAPKDIFTKHANENPNAAQIAPSAEQPVDLNAATKSAAAPNTRAVVVPLVPGTGDPRPVKTVVVRADGSLIAEKSDPDLLLKANPPGPKVIAMPSPVQPLGNAAAGIPALPAEPVAQSPDFVLEGPIPLPPERVADDAAEISLPLDAITTPMPTAPAPEPVATPTPVAPAPAASAPVASAPGKDFAVQFGAPETEAKGNELKARIEKQFASSLTGGTVTVVKGDSNGKPVFRVRAVGYSRDEASAVCQQVTAAGGQCFVSKNN